MKIILFCSAGVSTSVLVNKMKESAQSKNKDYDIEAHSLSEFDKYSKEADVILIGPQVSYKLNSLKNENPNLVIDCIPFDVYGMMNGEAAIAYAEKLLNKE